MNAPTLIRPETRGFDFMTVGKPRCKVELNEYSIRIGDFPYFDIYGHAVLQATLDDDGIGFFVEMVEVYSPIAGKDGRPLTRILSNGADTSDELKLWHMIKASIEADETMLEAVRAEFAFDDWRHSVEEIA